MMTPERLAEIRRHVQAQAHARRAYPGYEGSWNARALADLLDYVDLLIQERINADNH